MSQKIASKYKNTYLSNTAANKSILRNALHQPVLNAIYNIKAAVLGKLSQSRCDYGVSLPILNFSKRVKLLLSSFVLAIPIFNIFSLIVLRKCNRKVSDAGLRDQILKKIEEPVQKIKQVDCSSPPLSMRLIDTLKSKFVAKKEELKDEPNLENNPVLLEMSELIKLRELRYNLISHHHLLGSVCQELIGALQDKNANINEVFAKTKKSFSAFSLEFSHLKTMRNSQKLFNENESLFSTLMKTNQPVEDACNQIKDALPLTN